MTKSNKKINGDYMEMKYRLGLDVGTNSLGWSVIEVDAEGKTTRIEQVGSRIFSEGRDAKTKATLAADRRLARSARRNHDRYKLRRKDLLNALTKYGLFPQDEEARKALKTDDPLELRSRAVREKLEPNQIGRALFHLNQRRGFQSNRKDQSEENTSGKVANSARKLLQEMGLIGDATSKESYEKLSAEEKKSHRQQEAKNLQQALEKLKNKTDLTYGTFLYQRKYKDKKSTRARPSDDGKLYEIYPTRDLYKDEFDKICRFQQNHHLGLLTVKVVEALKGIIFFQRPLKPQERGRCAYLKEEIRAFRASPTFQKFRIIQEINNLEWGTSEGTKKLRDYPESRDSIIKMLEEVKTSKGLVVWSKIQKMLKKQGIVEGKIEFTLASEKRKGLDGNLTSFALQHEDCVGLAWHEDWDLDKQEALVDLILDDSLEDDKVVAELMGDKFKLDKFHAENCLKARFPEGTANLSVKAAGLLLDEMQQSNCLQPNAVQTLAERETDFDNPFTRAGEGKVLKQLPYYGEVFADGRHIIPGTGKDEDRKDNLKYWGGVTNPTVHIALNQIRWVVNELIKRFGQPDSIAIELGRDLPAGDKRRKELEKEQRDNQKTNKKLDQKLEDQKQTTNRDNRLRLRLWEELGKSPTDRFCPFSGKKIGFADLFNGKVQIDHLIPFSKSLDNSRANKVVCMLQANQDKGNQTPWQAFHTNPGEYKWEEIFKRSQNLPKSKQWRFQENALEIWKGDNDFTSRHLNDTRYIGRLAKEYLEGVCTFNKIDVLTGRLTALLRKHWGLNNVLNSPKTTDEGEPKPRTKNRDDHRHHAVDAIVIGMTTSSMLQQVSRLASLAEEAQTGFDLFIRSKEQGRGAIDPWQNFRREVKDIVQKIVVSHRVKDKKGGRLHEATAYGIVKGDPQKDKCELVARKPIRAFENLKHCEEIRDLELRRLFCKAFEEGGIESVQKLAVKENIRSLRCLKKEKVIPVTDKQGNIYKYYKGGGNWATEIYELPADHNTQDPKWKEVVISRFEANQAGFKAGQTKRPHPAAKLVMRLHASDCIEIEEDGQKRLLRLQKMSAGKLVFTELPEANVDARNTDKDDPFRYFVKSANSLKELKPRKIKVSFTGQITYPRR